MKTDFQFHKTTLSDLVVIEPFFAQDERGYLLKCFELDIFNAHGIRINPYESFESLSSEGVLRGLHFQKRHWQCKLVRCLAGKVFDVAVDLRKNSPTFGKWEGFYLSASNRKMVFVPEGFAHGFLTLQDETLISYLCGDKYDPESDGGIRWDDPDIGVCWPFEQISKDMVISEKDNALPLLSRLTF